MEKLPLISTTNSIESSPSSIPIINLTCPKAKLMIVKASEEFGFFKVINHGVPMDLIRNLESEAMGFFSLPAFEKENSGLSNALKYGNKNIGRNGDIGWIEYLIMSTKLDLHGHQIPQSFRCALSEYLSAVKILACELLELVAEGLKIQPRDVFSRLIRDEESDSLFRLNHYPPCPENLQASQSNFKLLGFGEHTDPQIISLLTSNQASGYEILLKDGNWLSVTPDPNSFFVNIGDCLQVMTNGRFRSVRHRVVAKTRKPRLSMVYFGGPLMAEKIGPMASLIEDGKPILYKELTWFEYITTAFKTPLAHDRLVLFQKMAFS